MREPQKRENLVQATDGSVAEATDSHFISAALSLGWETSRCQIRAWNDSVCGVMVSGLITGIRTQTSDTWAVNPPSRPTMPQIRGPDLFGILKRAHQVGTNSVGIATADGKDEYRAFWSFRYARNEARKENSDGYSGKVWAGDIVCL